MNDFEGEELQTQVNGLHELLEVLLSCVDQDDCCNEE
jgi:hypothetical protein